MEFLKKILPADFVAKARKALLFRAEDPNYLLQILPPRWPHHSVQRIQGFRQPSPGSRTQAASIPIRESSDDLYNINYYYRNPNNLKTGDLILLNTPSVARLLESDKPQLPAAYKRKISLLPYDKSGLRTTKTTTWAAVDAVLATHAMPTHLPEPSWTREVDALESEREKRGLPPATGRPYKFKRVSQNYNEVRW